MKTTKGHSEFHPVDLLQAQQLFVVLPAERGEHEKLISMQKIFKKIGKNINKYKTKKHESAIINTQDRKIRKIVLLV